MDADQKIIEELNVIHAVEAALVQTLTAHIAITPRGPYRSILDRHLGETRAQARRIQGRLGELGANRSPMQVAMGTVNTVVGQALAFGKAPVDFLRGTSGEEKLLKNCRDEIAAEALEIASYDALEALAEAVGDEKTAVLAREHRLQEEVALGELRGVIGDLARAVVAAELRGETTYDVASTGMADALRRGTRLVRGGAREAREADADPASPVVPATDGQAASQAATATEPPAAPAPPTAPDTAAPPAPATEPPAAPAPPTAPDTAATPAPPPASGVGPGSQTAAEDLPIPGYPSLTVERILPQLAELGEPELARLEAFERGNRNRKRILGRIAQLRERPPEPGD